MRICKKLSRIKTNLFGESSKKVSYSQCGEDLIISYVLDSLKIDRPYYLDIGAYHPFYLSNTAFFYKKGARGVCIEPNFELYKKLVKYRKRDKCLNVGVGLVNDSNASYYQMSESTLNTFSKEEALLLQSTSSKKIISECKVPILSFSSIMSHLERRPNFISFDIEGVDYEVLKSFQFEEYRPEVFCIETLTYSENKQETKKTEIINLMLDRGYFPYADTYINTIFIDKDIWKNR